MRFPITLLLILVSAIAHAQSPRVKGFLDKVISIMKEHAMNSKNVDWPAVTEKAYKLADKAKTPEDAGESITFLFQSLGDFHGVLRYKEKYFHCQHPLSLPDIYKTELARKDNKFFYPAARRNRVPAHTHHLHGRRKCGKAKPRLARQSL